MSAVEQEKRLITAEDFWELPDDEAERRGKRLELVRGEVREKSALGMAAGLVSSRSLFLVSDFVRDRRLGVVGAGGGCVLRRNPDTVLVPNVSFVACARLPDDRVPEWFWPFAPDLAVEVVPHDDLAENLHTRIREYLEAGTRALWVLWTQTQSVTAYQKAGKCAELGRDEDLDGGEVLPGFSVRVGELFEVRARRS